MYYADTSFMVSMIVNDGLTQAVRAAYRRIGRPPLVFSPMHQLEVPNAIRLLHFLEALQLPTSKRNQADIRRHGAESHLAAMRKNKTFADCHAEWSDVMDRFEHLSAKHTMKIGARTLDVLQVASALVLHCKVFLTCDHRQAALAKATGMKVMLVTI